MFALLGVFASLLARLAVFLQTRGYLPSSVGATLLIVAPLGLLLGMPMPSACRRSPIPPAGPLRLVVERRALGPRERRRHLPWNHADVPDGGVAYLLAGLMLQVLRRHAVPAPPSPA